MEIIRVLHVFGTLNRGGAETRTMEIFRNINREKYQFDFVKHTEEECDFDDEIISLGGRIHVLPRFKILNLINYKNSWIKLFNLHKDYSIVHGHILTTAFLYYPVAKKHGIKKIIAHTRSASEDSLIKRFLVKLSRFHANVLIAVSKEASINTFGRFRTDKKTIILNNSINGDKFIFISRSRIDIRNEFNLGDEFVVGHVGRFHKSKNHLFLLNVYSEYLKINPNSKLIMVGDGPLKNKIIKAVRKLKIENKVIFTGLRLDVERFYSAFDILLFPSKFEGYPGVILEAQVSGLPIIMSKNITQDVIKSKLVKTVDLKSRGDWLNEIQNFDYNMNRENIDNRQNQNSLDKMTTFFEKLYSIV